MKTKFVTSYYAYHSGPPFWGQLNRENWYKYSLMSICKLGYPIICYTDEGDLGYNQILEIKNDLSLDNLHIKVFKLTNNPWQNKVYSIATNGNFPEYSDPSDWRYRASTQIYWMKFHLLELEQEPDINLYWIDCGLSHQGLFPKIGNSYYEQDYYHEEILEEDHKKIEHKFYQFDKIFNSEFVERVNAYHEGKIINLCHDGIANYDFNYFLNKLNLKITASTSLNYPVAGFFGGNSNLIPKYIKLFYEIVDLVLKRDDYLTLEQPIMCYINNQNPELFKNWKFSTFYHEDWSGAYSPNQISFSHFFTKPLN